MTSSYYLTASNTNSNDHVDKSKSKSRMSINISTHAAISFSHAGTKGRPKQQEKEKNEVTRELRDDDSRNRDTPNNKPPRKRLRVNRNKRYNCAQYRYVL